MNEEESQVSAGKGGNHMDLDEIKQIIELMEENNLAEFEMEKDGFRIAMRKSQPIIVNSQPAGSVVAPQVEQSAPQTGAGTGKAPEAEDEDKYETILSPMVGTYYASPSPDSEPYVRVGDEVDIESVVCILEAMKVMNEIKAEVRGRIADILVENTEPVEYGQPLFKVELLT